MMTRINGSSGSRNGRDGGRSGGTAQRSRRQQQASATAGSFGQRRRDNQISMVILEHGEDTEQRY